MTVSFLGYVFELWAGLAMSSVFRANDRINLYPAAPIRLATMLHTWTITKRGMGLIFRTAAFAKPTCSHTSNPPTNATLGG